MGINLSQHDATKYFTHFLICVSDERTQDIYKVFFFSGVLGHLNRQCQHLPKDLELLSFYGA